MIQDSEAVNASHKAYWEKFYKPNAQGWSPEVYGGAEDEDSDPSGEDESTTKPVLARYEWFLAFPEYRDVVCPLLAPCKTILHIGCGNSNFADELVQYDINLRGGPSSGGGGSRKRKSGRGKTGDSHTLRNSPPEGRDIINMDICENVVTEMNRLFPHRSTVVGDVCVLNEQYPQYSNHFDAVFDKGTVDAFLSGHPDAQDGCNPNMELYFPQVLRTLKPGGIFVTISINAKEKVVPYYYVAPPESLVVEGEEEEEWVDIQQLTIAVEQAATGGKLDVDEDQAGYIHRYGTTYTVFVARKGGGGSP